MSELDKLCKKVSQRSVDNAACKFLFGKKKIKRTKGYYPPTNDN